MVGGPGIGKTDALREVIRFWTGLPELHVAPSSVSRASLIDSLNVAERQILRPADPAPFTKFNSLQVAATEFGTFLTAYDGEFISTLNDIYDCVRYKESKRHMKNPIEIPHPQLNIIAGTTPAWLGGTLPETAWSEGFSSRLLLIYSGQRIKVDLFTEIDSDEILTENLEHDLRQIHAMYGQFSFEEKVAETLQAWYMADCPPVPDHPKLEHYLPRRHIHFLKICMAVSASRGGDYLIKMQDYQEAMDLFLEAEAFMPDIFKAMRFNSDANVYDEAYQFLYTLYVKEGKPIAEHRLIHFISQRMPSHSVAKVLEVMVHSNLIQIASISGPGGRATYIPTPPAERG